MLTDAKGLEKATGIPTNTWRYWRKQDIGPPAYKVNGKVLYDPAEVDAWMRSHRTEAA